MSASPPKFLRINQLDPNKASVDPKTGKPTHDFSRSFNAMIASITSAVNSLKQQADDIQASLVAAGIALTTAEAARDLAMANTKSASLTTSFVDPTTVLSAEVDPADSAKAKITIANHTRKYGDGTSVAVTGGSISGLTQGVNYYIDYIDTAFAGGTVTYYVNTDFLLAGLDNPSGQHLVGNIVTPATSSAPPTTGGGPRPPGTYCVVLDTLILLANDDHDGPGEEIRAGDLRVGDMLWTRHERTMKWGAFPLSAVSHYEADILTAPGLPDATAEHPFWIDDQWVLMGDLGYNNGRATIAHMTVFDAHTFVARHPDEDEQVLCHNKTEENYFD